MYREKFLPTPSARRATQQISDYVDWLDISTHALREEGDERAPPLAHWAQAFLPTPSARRATSCLFLPLHQNFNFYPRPPRGGRPWIATNLSATSAISTHALREEGDRPSISRGESMSVFLPTPSARRATQRYPNWLCVQGISTHALREEGDSRGCRAGGCRSISTHALREEGDVRPLGRKRFGEISTHALREEGDTQKNKKAAADQKFLPTPSARRATLMRELAIRIKDISTHALREEGDHQHLPAGRAGRYFYPRPPRGGRHILLMVF